jgi:flavin-dependent thymidylate synthase
MKIVTPKVELINYTQNADELLLFTKYTRLSNDAEGALETIRSWSEERRKEELDYIFNTIESSHEFLTYTFCITGVTREFSHQIVRTRSETKGEFSIQQESQRTVNLSEGFDYGVPQSLINNKDRLELYTKQMESINKTYSEIIEKGGTPQEARCILPTKVATKIILKFDLRTLSHIMQERLCTRASQEIQEVARLMRDEVIKIHPFVASQLRVYCSKVGTCRFKNYHSCPLKGQQFNPNTGLTYYEDEKYNCLNPIDTRSDKNRPATKQEIEDSWIKLNEGGGFEAIPDMQKK